MCQMKRNETHAHGARNERGQTGQRCANKIGNNKQGPYRKEQFFLVFLHSKFE